MSENDVLQLRSHVQGEVQGTKYRSLWHSIFKMTWRRYGVTNYTTECVLLDMIETTVVLSQKNRNAF